MVQTGSLLAFPPHFGRFRVQDIGLSLHKVSLLLGSRHFGHLKGPSVFHLGWLYEGWVGLSELVDVQHWATAPVSIVAPARDTGFP